MLLEENVRDKTDPPVNFPSSGTLIWIICTLRIVIDAQHVRDLINRAG